MTRRLMAGLMVGALAMLPLACGDDDDGGLGSLSDSADTSSDDTAADDDDDDAAAPDTTSDDTKGDASTEEPTGGDLDRWCELTSDLNDDPFENVDETSPEDIETAFNELEDQMGDFVDAAPDQIRDDAETVVNAFRELRELLETHDYDLEEVATDPAFEEVIANPDVEAASDVVDEFEEANCP